jgi:hypothetical protein
VGQHRIVLVLLQRAETTAGQERAEASYNDCSNISLYTGRFHDCHEISREGHASYNLFSVLAPDAMNLLIGSAILVQFIKDLGYGLAWGICGDAKFGTGLEAMDGDPSGGIRAEHKDTEGGMGFWSATHKASQRIPYLYKKGWWLLLHRVLLLYLINVFCLFILFRLRNRTGRITEG